MGQTESVVEADESQTDVEQDHPSPDRPRFVVAGRSSVERRRLSRPVRALLKQFQRVAGRGAPTSATVFASP